MEKKERSWLGMDLGGTKLLVGEMDREGNILRTMQVPSGPLDQAEGSALMAQTLESFLTDSIPGYEPCAIGIGMIGHVDASKGLWMGIDPNRENVFPLAERISARFGLPCAIDNDVKSATKAEMLFGYGRYSRDFIYINVGTGIAAGTVTNGHLISGGHANAGEVGHTSSGLRLHVPCICGREDCVEPLASGLGMDQMVRRWLPEYPGTMLKVGEDRVDIREVFANYDRDELCRRVTDTAAEALANMIMNLVRVTDPDTIILGGSVVADGFLLTKVQEHLSDHTMRYVTNGVRITELPPQKIGLMGACTNAILAGGMMPQ